MASFARQLRRGSIVREIVQIGNNFYLVFKRKRSGGNGKLTKARRKRPTSPWIILDMKPMSGDGPVMNPHTGL